MEDCAGPTPFLTHDEFGGEAEKRNPARPEHIPLRKRLNGALRRPSADRTAVPKGAAVNPTATILVATVVAAACVLSPPTDANAGDGTPPAYRCAKTFVAGMDLTTEPSLIDTVRVDYLLNSAHFLSLVASPGGSCPPPPHSLQITGALSCGGPPIPVNLGPFPITPGFSELGPLLLATDFPITCTATLDFIVTLSDGTQLKRTLTDASNLVPFAGESAIAGADRAAAVGPSPLELERVGNLLVRVHPGDQASLTFHAINNNLAESVSGTVTVTARNLALLPEVPVGPNDRAVGAFSLADPGGGDTPPIGVSGASLGGCLPFPSIPPYQQKEIILNRPIFLPAGGSEPISCDVREYPLCPTGTMAEIDIRIDGMYSGGAPAHAATGAVVGVDHAIAPQFSWPGSGRAVSYVSGSIPAGPAVGIVGDGSPLGNEGWRFDIGAVRSSMVYLANGVPPSSGTFNFSGPTYLVNGLSGRYVSEISFITPRTPDTATITLNVPFDVLPSVSSPNPIATRLVSLQLITGAPNGFADQCPILMGTVHVMSKDGIADSRFNFLHQVSAVGVVDGTFAFDPMENLSVSAAILSTTRYQISTTWRRLAFSKAGDVGGAANLAQYIGFSMTNDIRGFAEPAAPYVSVGGTPPAPAPALLLARPNPATRWAIVRLSGTGGAAGGVAAEAAGAPAAGRSLRLFDAAGRLVRDLAIDATGEARWDLVDESGSAVAAGVYFLRAERGGEVLANGRINVIR